MLSALSELFWIWGPWVYNRSMEVLELAPKIYRAVYKDLYGTKGWIFINGTSQSLPIPEEIFDTDKIQLNLIKWKATTEPPAFVDPNYQGSIIPSKHISFLAFSVLASGNELIDLTDWVNDIKWSGQIQPLPIEIFSLWCCKNKSPLIYYSTDFTVEIVLDDGTSIKKGLNEFAHTNIHEDDDASETN